MDKFKDLDNEALAALALELRSKGKDLVTEAAGNPTAAQIEAANQLSDDLDEVEAEVERREAAAAKFGTLADRFADVEEEPEPTPTPEATATEDEPEPDADAEPAPEPAEQNPPVEEATSTVEQLAAKSKKPAVPLRSRRPMTITAAADTGFASGQQLDTLTQVAQAAINRAKGFPAFIERDVPPGTQEGEPNLVPFSTASFAIDFPDELMIEPERMNEEKQAEIIELATAWQGNDVQPGLTAAGWCAPSETSYDIEDDSTQEGLLSMAEVGIRRGGMRFAVNPLFSAFYANPGFMQTEAQAIANTSKPCVTVDCPTFTDVRLDVEGICIKVPILTNVGYPEYVRTFISGTMTAHAHWVNANIIGRLVTAAGAARTFTGLGGSVDDALEAFLLVADQRRELYRLSMNHPMEGVLPFYVKNMFKIDLARRNGRTTPATDAELNAVFAIAKLNVQFVYDWQALPQVDNAGTAGVNERNTYPTTYQALVYPAGTFVKGVQPVINLSTVYDTASLQVNTYTGLFTEQAFLIAQKKFGADLLTLPVCNAGRRGALNLTCP